MQCPWALKGTVMRVLNERLADRDVDLTDGIKLFDERGWVQVLPDADEPLIHIYAEGTTPEDSEALEVELHRLIDEVLAGEEVETSTRG
jgi:mannose-1-phosphate guanylyltransferase/phosphomannomutase